MVERYEVWAILGYVYGLFARFHTIDSVLDDMHLAGKYSEHSSIIWPVWPNG